MFNNFSSGCGAVGSVPVWGAGGRKFESSHPDFFLSYFWFLDGQTIGMAIDQFFKRCQMEVG